LTARLAAFYTPGSSGMDEVVVSSQSGAQHAVRGFYVCRIKRPLDLALSAVFIVLLAPVLVLTSVAVRLFIGSPVLFRQVRTGCRTRRFVLLKFRTMDSDGGGGRSPAAERVTRLGRFLRRSGIDELPQLFNVLAGSMSLVGPRPLLPEYLPMYTREQARRHDVRPGMTGWAQVKGRNANPWAKKLELDVWYVDHMSFTLDAKILCLTPLSMIRGEDDLQAGAFGSTGGVG